MRDIPAENLVVLDEIPVLLGIIRDHSRSEKGERLYDQKTFNRKSKTTVIGEIIYWIFNGKSNKLIISFYTVFMVIINYLKY